MLLQCVGVCECNRTSLLKGIEHLEKFKRSKESEEHSNKKKLYEQIMEVNCQKQDVMKYIAILF